jgi:2-dehydro-3-deoxy-D-arabinonate dehydratase
MRIQDMDGLELFAGETTTSRMRRTPSELLSWLTRDNPVPSGSVLLTGTGLVPDPDYTMLPGHRIEITIDGIGALVNVVGPIEGER